MPQRSARSPGSDNHRKRVLDEARLKLLKEAAIWKDAFGTEQGKKCLDLLKIQFYDRELIATDNPLITQMRAAQRDLVRFIIDQIEFTGE